MSLRSYVFTVISDCGAGMKSNLKIGRTIKKAVRRSTSGVANVLINSIAKASAPGFLFGMSAVTRSQVGPARIAAMKELVGAHFHDSINMIEVGSWFGEGSTKGWVECLPQKSKLMLIDSWTPYVTKADLAKGALAYRSMDDVAFAAFHNTALCVLNYEEQRPDLDISLIRANSAEYLKLLGQVFDLIYIDGSHYYQAVKADIIAAKKIAKPGFSIICGDDYEMHSDPELVSIAMENKDRDWISHSRGSFHPGVLLAVKEEFGKVSMKDGFWWTICRNGEFTAT